MPWREEYWRDVPGYEGIYMVSNEGHVKRVASTNNHTAGYVLHPALVSGYPRVSLARGVADTKEAFIHTLVAEAFHGPRPDGYQVNHKNGNKLDNRPENLEWVTPSQNALHASRVLHAFKVRGEQHGHAKLTEAQVKEMRYLASQGWLHGALCAKFGITQPAVSRILRGLRWGHVGGY